MSEKEAKEILGLGEDYDKETLNKAYREAAKEFHPDKNEQKNNEQYYRAMFQEITEANKILKKALNNPKLSYEMYSNQKIRDLERKYLLNESDKKYKLSIISYVEKKIAHMKDYAKEYNDISLFDKDYKMIEECIIDGIIKHRQNKLDLLEKECVVDLETKKAYISFCDKISDITNIYQIENMCSNFKKKNGNKRINVVNDIYLESQKSYIIKKYIGKSNFVDNIFNSKKEEIMNSINNFFDTTNKNQSISEYEIRYLILGLNIETSINNFKKDIFDTIIDKSYLDKYPYVRIEIFSKLNKIKNPNLTLIYNVYNEIKISIKETIAINIKEKLEKIIRENKNLNYFNQVEDKINEKTRQIIESIDLNTNKPDSHDYEEELRYEIAKLVANYHFLNKRRNQLIEELKKLRISSNNEYFKKLNEAQTYDEINNIIEDATKYVDSIKREKQSKEEEDFKAKKIAAIKGLLNIKSLSINTYSDSQKKNLADKIDYVLKLYKDGKIDDINMLIEISFDSYETDLKIVDSIMNENNNKTKESTKNIDIDDGFKDIEEIFRNKELETRKEYAIRVYNILKRKFDLSFNLDDYRKMDILYQAKDIINNYVNFGQSDISKLLDIEFKNYDTDKKVLEEIIQSGYNIHSRH